MKRNKSYERKKKAAAVLAVVLVLAMILSVIAPFIGSVYASPLGTAGKEAVSILAKTQEEKGGNIGDSLLVTNNKDITLSAEIGIGESVIMGKTTPFQFVFSNTGDDFKGEVQVLIYSYERNNGEGGEYSIYYQPLELASGATKKVTMNINVNSASSSTKVGLVNEKGEVIFSKMVPMNYCDPGTIGVGILTDNKNGLHYLKSLKMSSLSEEEQQVYRVNYDLVTFLNQDSFPDSEEVLRNFKMIVINDFNIDVLSDQQRKALTDWLYTGGFLVLGTGPNADKVLKGFDGLFPYTIGESRHITNFPVLSELMGIDLIGIMPITEIDLGEKAKPVLEEDGSIITSSLPIENGIVVVHSFDLALDPFSMFSDLKEVLKTLYQSERPDSFMINTEYDYSYDYMSGITNSLPPLETKRVSLIFLFLVLYIFLLGPIMYFILKKKDKREWGWITIPVLAFVVTGLVFAACTKSPYKSSILSNLSVISLEEESNIGDAKVRMTVKSPKNGAVEVSSNDHLALQILDNYRNYNYFYSQSGKDMYARKILCGTGTAMTTFDNKKWGANQFSFDTQIELEGTLDTDITLDGNRLVGTIENKTGVDLEDIIILFGRQFFRYENLKNGEKIEINETFSAFDTNDPNQNYYSMYSMLEELFGFEDLREKVKTGEVKRERFYELSKRMNIIEYLGYDFPSYYETVPIQVFAFNNEKLFSEEFLVNGKPPVPVSESVFIKNSDFSLSDAKDFDIPFGFFNPTQMVGEDGSMFYHRYGTTVYIEKGNSLECTFTFPKEVQMELIQFFWSDFEQRISNQEIYSAASGEWEPLLETEYRNVSDYQNEYGEIKVRCSVPEYEEIYMPQIRVKGGQA